MNNKDKAVFVNLIIARYFYETEFNSKLNYTDIPTEDTYKDLKMHEI